MTNKFGWCTTQHHKSCRVEYTDWNNKQQKCSCDCHSAVADSASDTETGDTNDNE